MNKSKILRRIAMIASLIMLIVSTANTTYGFIVTSTDPISNIFVPDSPLDPEAITVNLGVNKTVNNTGKESIGPDDFEFVLENVATGEKTAVRSGSDGKANFGLTFDKADAGKTYTYRLSETDEKRPGVTYDDRVYEITVSVTLDESNELTATVVVDGIAAEEPVAEFENTYHADVPPSPPTGDNSNITFWFIMMIVSATVLVTLIIYDRRRARV